MSREVSDGQLRQMIDRVGNGDGIDGPEVYAALGQLQWLRSLTSNTSPLADELLDALKTLLELHDAMGIGRSHIASKARAAIARAEPNRRAD